MKIKTPGICLLAAAAVSLAGCSAGAGPSSPSSTGHQGMTPGMVMQGDSTTGAGEMTPGMVMQDGSTMAPGSPGTAPSEAAKMICADETRDNITTVLSVAPQPNPASSWRGGTYTCTYRLPMGSSIVLSVHESADDSAAAAYTEGLRPSLSGAKDLKGLTKIAFGTTNGVVVLQKDNDTLRVDTSGLPSQSKLYAHRADFAYEIATVIMGCWTGSPTG